MHSLPAQARWLSSNSHQHIHVSLALQRTAYLHKLADLFKHAILGRGWAKHPVKLEILLDRATGDVPTRLGLSA